MSDIADFPQLNSYIYMYMDDGFIPRSSLSSISCFAFKVKTFRFCLMPATLASHCKYYINIRVLLTIHNNYTIEHLYFTGLIFRELLFWQFCLKKFREYAVEAGNGAKCQDFQWITFANGIIICKNRENLDPRNISAIILVIVINYNLLHVTTLLLILRNWLVRG